MLLSYKVIPMTRCKKATNNVPLRKSAAAPVCHQIRGAVLEQTDFRTALRRILDAWQKPCAISCLIFRVNLQNAAIRIVIPCSCITGSTGRFANMWQFIERHNRLLHQCDGSSDVPQPSCWSRQVSFHRILSWKAVSFQCQTSRSDNS